MKKLIFLTILLVTFSSLTFSQSVINYQNGTIADVQSGASICADSVVMNGTFTGGGTICGLLYKLTLTCIIQGFYDSSSGLMVSDTAEVFLRKSVSPYAVIDSDKAVLSSNGTGTFTFANAVNGVNYYLEITHRNSIETWSNSALVFTGGTLIFDFTSAASQAFGGNIIQVNTSPVTFAIYSGDVNQDGFVDLLDLNLVFNDAGAFVTGYVVTDINGDNVSDLSDLIITFNNSSKFVTKVIP